MDDCLGGQSLEVSFGYREVKVQVRHKISHVICAYTYVKNFMQRNLTSYRRTELLLLTTGY